MLLATIPQQKRPAGTYVLPGADGADSTLLFPAGVRAASVQLALDQADLADAGLVVRLLVEGLQDGAWLLVDETTWQGGQPVRPGRVQAAPSTRLEASYGLPFSRLRLSVALNRSVRVGATFEAS